MVSVGPPSAIVEGVAAHEITEKKHRRKGMIEVRKNEKLTDDEIIELLMIIIEGYEEVLKELMEDE